MGKGKSLVTGLAAAVLVAAPMNSVFGVPVTAQDNTANDTAPKSVSDGVSGDGIGDQTANFLNDIIGNANENSCLMFRGHDYEVCTAYIFNAVFADLVPYYKFAHSRNVSVARLVLYRLDSRFSGQANALLHSRVSNWQTGDNNVDVPVIKVLSVNADLAANSATLQTQESWLVTDRNLHALYQEDGGYHIVTMQRISGYVLHKWVVTGIE